MVRHRNTRRRGGDNRTDAEKSAAAATAPRTDATPPTSAPATAPPARYPFRGSVINNPYAAEDEALVTNARRTMNPGGRSGGRSRKSTKKAGRRRRYSRRH